MNRALGHLDGGRLAQARDAYVSILECAPELHQAVHNLGLVALRMGDLELARDLVQQALRLAPETAQYWVTLGVAAEKLKDDDLCVRSLARATELDPNDGLAWYNYANRLALQQRYSEAVRCLERAAALRPDLTGIRNKLGSLYLATVRYREAEDCFALVLEREPDSVAGNANLALVYAATGRRGEAIARARRTLELEPAAAEIRYNLGQWLLKDKRPCDALKVFEDGLSRQPGEPLLQMGRINALEMLGRLDETFFEVRWLLERGDLPRIVHRTLLLSLHYHPQVSAAELFREHRRWAERHADSLTPERRAWRNARDPERRLRVGYVSPALHQHPVSFFLAPILAAHAASDAVEAICYSCGRREDSWTAQLRKHAACWCDARALGSAELAERIERDGVDILVDLAGHTSGDQLLVFAREPAPLQVSWLGYFNTTGMKAMDYILVDPALCPAGEEALYVERVLRLDPCYLAYRGPDYAPEAAPPPALERGYVTFGSFNSLSKVGFGVLGLWTEVLRAVPGSRLLLRNVVFDEPSAREMYLAELARLGVDLSHVSLEGGATHEELLAYYSKLDVALDPFPYNGGTTTCEALWMGLPVVTLAGDRFVGRAGQTILTAAGLEELVAHSPQEYVRMAVDLATDAGRLAALRAGMRERVRSSALGDTEGFTRKLEHAYRTIWRDWCAANAG